MAAPKYFRPACLASLSSSPDARGAEAASRAEDRRVTRISTELGGLRKEWSTGEDAMIGLPPRKGEVLFKRANPQRVAFPSPWVTVIIRSPAFAIRMGPGCYPPSIFPDCVPQFLQPTPTRDKARYHPRLRGGGTIWRWLRTSYGRGYRHRLFVLWQALIEYSGNPV